MRRKRAIEEEGVSQDSFQCWPLICKTSQRCSLSLHAWGLTGIRIQYGHDKILRCCRNLFICRELVAILPYPLVDGLDVFCLEWWSADKQRVPIVVIRKCFPIITIRSQNDTDRPDIHLKAVSVGSIKQYFRRNVIRCSAYSSALISTSSMMNGASQLPTFSYLPASLSKPPTQNLRP